jgi:PAS domain S-box-containing protein
MGFTLTKFFGGDRGDLSVKRAARQSPDQGRGRLAGNFARCLVGVSLLFLATTSILAAVPKRVLVIHSFGRAAPPFTTASTAFESTLTGEMGEAVDLDEVSLDVARYASLDLEEALVELMRKRQARWQPDLVVPIGSPAGIFVAQNRDRLFAPSTPVIYTGMDQRRLPAGVLQHNAAFVGASYDLPGLVEDILQLAPATTNIVVVIGATPLEQFWTEVLRQEFQPFTNRVSFTWFNDLPFDQMLERSARLPPHSFMLLVLLMRDAAGVSHNADEALRRLHEVANAPVNGFFRNQLGMGIVGGRLYADDAEGAESARIAIRILRGESASNFPARILPPSPPQYDWRELQRWGISANRLPPGSIVQFREPTAWERYRWRIIGAVSLCLVESLLIFILLANLVKRRSAERSLTESGNRLRAILDTAVEGIITVNDRGVMESVNPAAEKIFGYSAAEMIGQNVSLLGPANQDLAILLVAGRSKLNGNGRDVRGRRKDGSEFPIDLTVSEVTLANRRVFTGFVRDLSERRRSEIESRDLRRALTHAGRVSLLGQLSSSLAHELSQPLGAVLRNAETAELLLQDPSPDLEELRAIIVDIRKDDQRAGHVIDRLRSLLKRRDLELQCMEMDTVISEVVSLIRSDASVRHVGLEFVTARNVPMVKGDRIHLQQVMLNLIVNAMDALNGSLSGKGRVRIQLGPVLIDRVEVSVSDNGPGFPDGTIDRLFEPFFTTKENGMGMGLPISKAIIEAHHGQIWAENGPLGGAVFHFTVPICKNGDAA